MFTFSIVFENSNDEPIYVQVEPWAGFYALRKGEKIEIVAETDKTSHLFGVDEIGTTRILQLWTNEYYVVLNGQRIHWQDYYLDRRLCPYCLGLLNSEETWRDVCRCSRDAS